MDDMSDFISLRKDYFDNIINRRYASGKFISVHEEFLHEHQDELRRMQTFHKVDLKEMIFTRLENYISPKDSIYFLIESYRFGLDGYAIDILNEVAVAKKHINESGLFDILKEVATGISSPQVAVSIHSENIKEKPKVEPKPSIDTDRLNEMNKAPSSSSVKLGAKPIFNPARMKNMFNS